MEEALRPNVPALDASVPRSSPGRGSALCSWARTFTLVVALAQLYKCVPVNLMLGVNSAMD